MGEIKSPYLPDEWRWPYPDEVLLWPAERAVRAGNEVGQAAAELFVAAFLEGLNG